MSNQTSNETPAPTGVQSVDRAAGILRLLAERPELGASEVARHLDVHRSTALRLLTTLESHGLVEQIEQRGHYRLGLGVLRLAGAVTHRADLARDAQAVCDALCAEFEETINVAVLNDGAALNIVQTMSPRRVAVLRQYVGEHSPLHASSTGKVLLAHAPATLRESVLSRALERFTPTTITDARLLRAELATVSRQGWAMAVAEWEPETAAVAVPVHGAGGDVVAALSITAPTYRMDEGELPPLVKGLLSGADDLSRRLGYYPAAG